MNRDQRTLYQVNIQYGTFDLPEGYSRDAKVIGSGTYGIVVRTLGTTTRIDGSRNRIKVDLAIKKFRPQQNVMRMFQLCYREMKLLQHLDHPNIARILDLYTPARNANELTDKIYLVMEFAGSGLDTLLDDSKKTRNVLVSYPLVPRIVCDTLRALQYLKAANVLHRDLKPSNLAIHSTGKAVLIDYGFARSGIVEKSSALTAEAGTAQYSAPEVTFWKGGSYGREADIWSLGCIIAELISWEHLFKDNKSKISTSVSLIGPISSGFSEKVEDDNVRSYIESQNMKIFKESVKRREVEKKVAFAALKQYFINTNKKVADLSDPKYEVLLDFLRRCLEYDPVSRISIDDALLHPFLAGLYVPQDLSKVQPLIYDDSERSIDDWKCVLYNEIRNFRAREDTPRP